MLLGVWSGDYNLAAKAREAARAGEGVMAVLETRIDANHGLHSGSWIQ